MLQNVSFLVDDPLPSWWANRIQQFLSTLAENLQVVKLNDTTVQLVCGANDKAAVVAISGKWRFRESSVNRSHPGGAAGVYRLWATTADNVVAGIVDSTNYTFNLAITAPAAVPTIVPGTVDLYREIGAVRWDGAKITEVVQTVDGVLPHARSHAPDGSDPLAPTMGYAPSGGINAIFAVTSADPSAEMHSSLRCVLPARSGDVIEAGFNLYVESPANVFDVAFMTVDDANAMHTAFPPRGAFNPFFRSAGYVGSVDGSAVLRLAAGDVRANGTVVVTLVVHTGGQAASVGGSSGGGPIQRTSTWLKNLGPIA